MRTPFEVATLVGAGLALLLWLAVIGYVASGAASSPTPTPWDDSSIRPVIPGVTDGTAICIGRDTACSIP